MNGMRKLIGLVMAIAITSFSLPVLADNGKKTFNLDMAIVTAPPAAPPYTVTATIRNEPTGNSTINSFNLIVTGLTIVDVVQPSSGTANSTGSSVTVKNMHPLKPGQSLTVTLHVSACGAGLWGAAVWTGSSLNGQNFNLVPLDSNLETPIACGNVPSGGDLNVQDSLNPDCVTGIRGFYDKDGTVGTSVPYFVWNTVPTNGQLHFQWPDNNTGDPLATFEYAVCASGDLPDHPNTQVAWLNMNGSSASTPGNPAYVAAQPCLDPDQLPAPYGALVADVGPNDTMIAVNTTGSIPYPGNPPVNQGTPGPEFDVVIGIERITVQLVCLDFDGDPDDAGDCTDTPLEGTALNVVQRGVGGTAVPTVPHPAGALVMSTPLPLLPPGVPAPYVAGNQALMCIADQRNNTEGGGHFTTFIDIGDGWGNHP